MTVTPVGRHLLVQLNIGQTSAGKPKLHNCTYQHVDVAAADTSVANVLSAIAPLFADAIYAMARVDTVQIQPSTAQASSTGNSGGGATA